KKKTCAYRPPPPPPPPNDNGISTAPLTLPIITTLTNTISLDSGNKKGSQLLRQDYACLDSSEAQSDDSHLTRDSLTRESQNDELSSSTLDKIDITTLPLPALPPKKRRIKLRVSPSKHNHNHRYDSVADNVCATVDGLNGSNSRQNQVNSTYNRDLSAFKQYAAKRRESLEASTRSFNEKLKARRMHYHMGAGGNGAANSTTSGASGLSMPTYLFGEQYYGSGFSSSAVASRKCAGPSSKEEIYLNKSGWVQVNTKRANDENRGYRRGSYAHQNGDLVNTIRVIQIDNTRKSDAIAKQTRLQHQHSMAEMPKFMVSKVEELIQRNEARLSNCSIRDPTLRPGYRIVDPQLASILNDRPGFLPVKNHDNDSPPPITPILSPPPAFQDTKSKHTDRRRAISSRPPANVTSHYLTTSNNLQTQPINDGVTEKGIVFSRSFEYDTRRPTPTDAYVNTFSRSFDGNLTERPPPLLPRRDRSPNFSTLTGNSPNYLTKRDSGGGSSGSLRSRDSSPKYQSPGTSVSSSMQSPQTQKTTAYLNTSVKEIPLSYSVAGHVADNSTYKYSPRSSQHERTFERSKTHNIPLGRSRKSQFSRASRGGPGANQVGNNATMSRFRSFDTTVSQRLNSCDSGARSGKFAKTFQCPYI
uniref:Uncharacterized protein n=1 Tax=Glossina brevipalpis TaxID=37001 RepID=A0A1A9WSK4_9MUSC